MIVAEKRATDRAVQKDKIEAERRVAKEAEKEEIAREKERQAIKTAVRCLF